MAGHGLCDSLAQQVVTTTEGVDAQIRRSATVLSLRVTTLPGSSARCTDPARSAIPRH
jgi:hypothetical protein